MKRAELGMLLGLVGALALLGACAPEESAEPGGSAASGVASEEAGEAARAEDVRDPMTATTRASDDSDYFLLEEFDWGDDPEVVEESLLFDPAFACHGTAFDRCSLVKVGVGDEEFLARTHFHQGGLWQVAFLTPDLQTELAEEHLERVWKALVAYATHWIGEPDASDPLPALDALEIGPPRTTHRWERKALDAEVAVGRRDEDLFYVGLFFFDPAVEARARPAWEEELRAEDAKMRKRRAAKAARAEKRGTRAAEEPPGDRPAGEDD